jgi:hypothetical protein
LQAGCSPTSRATCGSAQLEFIEKIDNGRYFMNDSEQILSNVKIDSFVEKNNFKSLFWCIAIVVGLTEISKIFFPNIEPRIAVVCWSIFVSAARLILVNNVDRENAKEKIIIAFFNIIPISLGAIGSYSMIVKLILNAFYKN